VTTHVRSGGRLGVAGGGIGGVRVRVVDPNPSVGSSGDPCGGFTAVT
jgi:hypothetical protein